MSKLPDKATIQAWVLLHRAHLTLLDEVESALKNNDLPPLDWYDVLLELHRAGSAGLRQYEIGERVLLKKHNLSRLLDRLAQQRLVSRQACEEDGRGNRILITPAGENLLKQIWPVYGQTIQNRFGDKLKRKDIAVLTQVLETLLNQEVKT